MVAQTGAHTVSDLLEAHQVGFFLFKNFHHAVEAVGKGIDAVSRVVHAEVEGHDLEGGCHGGLLF